MSYGELFKVERLPVFQNKMFSSEAEAIACPTGDMVLAQDVETGMVFNAAFDPSLLVYDADYQNEQACSDAFRQHLSDVAAVIDRHFKSSTLIEVGCGKGYFLEHLQKLGYRITGVDPAYEGTNSNIIKERFEPGLGLSADGILLRHVLEHMADPVEFLAVIARANGNKGKIYIEVPCFDWICRRRAWFDVHYEHVNYFRLADFKRMFGTVFECGHLFGEQYLYAVADLASLRVPHALDTDKVEFPQDFLADIQQHVSLLKQGKQCAIWGGASKGVIFALYTKRAGATIDMVIDINPAKWNKYLAASGLRVSPPEQALAKLMPGADIFVMNPNYLGEIMAQGGTRYKYRMV
jgi:SAM-dependent methyltransferase